MSESLVPAAAFLVMLACLPMLLRWVKSRTGGSVGSCDGQVRFISALAVGSNQKVVTVEVGPQHKRVWLTLGVTSQAISCLHCSELSQGDDGCVDAGDPETGVPL